METGERMPMSGLKEEEEPNDDNSDIDNLFRRSTTSVSDIRFLNPLMSAVRRGRSLKASFFQETKLDHLDMKETDAYRRNVFHYAVSKPDALRTLLENVEEKSSVDEALHQADNKQGETPIHRAAIIANIESLRILYEYDNSLLKLETTIGKRSVLHLAVKSKSMIAVKFVLSKDPDSVNSVDNMLQTPLHYAAGIKQSNVLELLISKGGDTTHADANNQLALHMAASKGLKKNVALLLRENPDSINVTDNGSRTSLLLASQNNFSDVVSYLLSLNADHEILDKFGLSAFDWAVSSKSPDVVQVFLETEAWKEIVSNSHKGPEGCLTIMIESMPEMAKMLLDKCITTKGSKENPNFKVLYDFFCLEQTGMNGYSHPQFEALNAMMEYESEICLGHPVSVKYVNVKWRKRGFKYSLASIAVNLIFHICLIVYAMLVVGKVHPKKLVDVPHGRNNSYYRDGVAPNAPGTSTIRAILLIITFATVIKNLFQLKVQGRSYFKIPRHHLEIMLHATVVMFLLPVTEELSLVHIGSGSFAVLFSWFTLIQFLKVLPVMGIYIIVVQTIFWTLMKILLVVIVYLFSFSSTFYILLAEYDSFRNIYMSSVSTFVAMTSGFEYKEHFINRGWHKDIYELKLIILILFILIMTIVVNNALIGLAVGDTDDVMKSAKFDKFKRRAQFVIHLEKSISRIPCLRAKADKFHSEFPERKKNIHNKVLDLLYFGSKLDTIEDRRETEEHENEIEMTSEDHFEKAIDNKLEVFRSNLRNEFKEIQDQIKNESQYLDEKMEAILEIIGGGKN